MLLCKPNIGSVPYVQSDTLRGRGDPQPPAPGGYPPTDYYATAGRTDAQGRAYAGASAAYPYESRQPQAYGGDGNYVAAGAPGGGQWPPSSGTGYGQYPGQGYDSRGAAGVPRTYDDEAQGYRSRDGGGGTQAAGQQGGATYPFDPSRYYDPRTGQPYIDPRTGVPYTDPRTGQPYRAA